MLLKKHFALESGLLRSAGFIPNLLGFPTPAEGGRRLGQQFTQVTAIDKDFGGKGLEAICAVDFHRMETPLLALNVLQPAVGAPLQPWLRRHPALQDLFGCFRSVSEAAHPVVVESGRLLQLQLPEKSAPESCLPTGQFMAIRGTDTCRTHHPPQPRSRGEQRRVRP